jgi:hypothetical protein
MQRENDDPSKDDTPAKRLETVSTRKRVRRVEQTLRAWGDGNPFGSWRVWDQSAYSPVTGKTNRLAISTLTA